MKKSWLWSMFAAAAVVLLAGCGRQSTLEKDAKPVVTKILKENLGSKAAKCLKVKITEKIDDKHYKAIATLDNGNELKVAIEDRGDMIYVTIPFKQ